MSRCIRASPAAPQDVATAARQFVALSAAFAMAPACAHGFGQRYELPLPLWLYLSATGAAIVLSFVVIAAFIRQVHPEVRYPHIDLPERWVRVIAHRWVVLAVRLVSALLFLITVAAAFAGSQDPYRNIAPVLVWIICWVGLVYVSALAGDVWPLLNPWRTLFRAAEQLLRTSHLRITPGAIGIYPAWLGVWPAFVLLFALSWVELVFPSPALPRHIGWLLVVYSAITWLGMALYGRETWLRSGEVFTVVFGVFARCAPIETRISPGRRAMTLRPFAAGLAQEEPASTSMTAFVLLILATVLFDGVLATPQWVGLETRLVALLPLHDDAAAVAVRTLGLAACWVLFAGAYLGTCAFMAALSGQLSALDFARTFVWTLVPIALAYHVAHYLGYLLTQGQYVVALASDPFGYGWNLFGTAGYRVDIGLVGARFSWYAAVIAIVVGHVIAVVLAHQRALRTIPRGAALRSQIPLTLLMVAYTFVSLSVLAEPITERPAPAAVVASSGRISVPADALLPDAATGELRRVGTGRTARQKLTYRMLGSAFHDGSKTSAADLLYALSFAYRWGTRGVAPNSHYDETVDAATRPMREHLVGIAITGIDTASKSFRVAEVNIVRELLIVDVYVDLAPGDAEQDAAVAPPWSTVPWHLLILMEEAVARGWAAFSKDEAKRRNVEWLDPARSERLKGRLAALVDGFLRDGYRPDTLRPFVTKDEARKRWAGLAEFYRARHHFLVTNGPYVLKRWSGNDVELEVFRDLSFPLGVGSYDAYAVPRRGFVAGVERAKDGLRIAAEIETLMKFQRSYEIQRVPMRSVDRDVLVRAAPRCRYMIVDRSNRVVLAGVAQPMDDSTFQVPLEGAVGPGEYTVFAEILVNDNAMAADVRSIPVVVAAARP
jgi:hypothetical protein